MMRTFYFLRGGGADFLNSALAPSRAARTCQCEQGAPTFRKTVPPVGDFDLALFGPNAPVKEPLIWPEQLRSSSFPGDGAGKLI